MRRYAFDVSAIQQHPHDIVAAHQDGERFVNRSLTCGVINGFPLRLQISPSGDGAWLLRSEGQEWLEGMSTATYGSWEECRAVLGLCWWVLPDGVVCYRVAGEFLAGPTCADLRRAARPWGISETRLFDIHPAVLVWPGLAIDNPRARCNPVLMAMRKEVNARPLQPQVWAEMADWCEDAGDDAWRVFAHAALAVLALLRPHLE